MKKSRDILREEIGMRYNISDLIGYESNRILDKNIIKLLFYEDSISRNHKKDGYVISEWFSNLYGIRQLPFKIMLQTLNITDKKLKDLVLKVKRKKLNLVFVGYGGTSVNTAYWLGKILDHTGNVNLFQNVSVFDDDKLEFSNLIRFPNDFSSSQYKYKADLYSNKNSLGMRYSTYNTRLSIYEGSGNSDQMPSYIEHGHNTNRDENESEYVLRDSPNTIFYGAPDLNTRKDIASTNLKFVAATHGDNTCSITLNPHIDENIQTEGYGLICLNTFFWNQLAMTIGFLQFLAEDDTINIDSEPDEEGNITTETKFKWDQEGRIFEFNFNDFIKDGKEGRASKKINFNLSDNLERTLQNA